MRQLVLKINTPRLSPLWNQIRMSFLLTVPLAIAVSNKRLNQPANLPTTGTQMSGPRYHYYNPRDLSSYTHHECRYREPRRSGKEHTQNISLSTGQPSYMPPPGFKKNYSKLFAKDPIKFVISVFSAQCWQPQEAPWAHERFAVQVPAKLVNLRLPPDIQARSSEETLLESEIWIIASSEDISPYLRIPTI